jgi:hypothetical protein
MERRCWLVERDYDDRDMIILVYATPDGARMYRRELSATLLSKTTVTAAREIPESDLRAVEDPETRDRYAAEADRIAETHDPDDPI